MQQSLFGGADSEDIPPPNPPEAEEWPIFDKLKKEREVVGIFITGHPLDDFSLEIEQFCRNSTKELADLKELKKKNRRITLAGMITNVEHRVSQKGKPWGKFTLEDYDGNHEFTLFGNDYVNHKNMINQDWFVFIEADVFYNDYRQNTELKITKVIILPDLINEKASSLEIELDAEKITESTVEDLSKVLDAAVGKLSVRIKLVDEKSQIALKSRKKGITINKEMAESLNKIENLKFKLA
jgi:DNA polymerase-3 subunit alpha